MSAPCANSASRVCLIALALIASRILFPNSKLATLLLHAPEAIFNSQDEDGNPTRSQKFLGLSSSYTLDKEIGLDLDTLSFIEISLRSHALALQTAEAH